ncbi:hypothetical protein NVP1187O_213 [Vibrio phage 1.187.O._10N.286.49.F1]|nr:hypothetical protein NVP1187O_213 [Vibrio phage 1.187.O._10N.286.49.F1]
MKNNRKIEVGQVRCLKTLRSTDYESELYVILNYNKMTEDYTCRYINDGEVHCYAEDSIREDIVVM